MQDQQDGAALEGCQNAQGATGSGGKPKRMHVIKV
jgi:hypothetical protein